MKRQCDTCAARNSRVKLVRLYKRILSLCPLCIKASERVEQERKSA